MSQIRQPARFAEVIDRPFGFLRRNLRPLLTIRLALMLPLSIVASAASVIAQLSMDPSTGTVSPFESLGPIFVIYGAAFAMMIGGAIASIATYAGTRRLLDGEPSSVGAAYREAIRPRTLGTVIVAGTLILLGFLCCIAPGIIAAIYLAFVVPIVIEGRTWGWDAVERSYRLIRYNPEKSFVASTSLKVFLVFLIIMAVSYAVGFLIALPSIVLGMMMAFRSASKGFATGLPLWYPILGGVQQVLSTIATSFVGLYSAAVFTMFYRDTRERMEGGSLERALAARLGPDLPGESGAAPLPPDAAVPAPTEPAPTEPAPAEPAAAEPDAARPDAGQHDAAEHDAAEHDASVPDAAEPDPSVPDAAQPDERKDVP